MTIRNLASLICLAAILVAPASAQVESANTAGPTITIDVLRVDGPGSRPAIDPLTGGITYTVGVTPDDSVPVFDPNNPVFPLGPGGSVAVRLGFTLSGDGLAPGGLSSRLPTGVSDSVQVNLNSTPLIGSTATEPGDGFVDAAIPGFPIFDFEVPDVTTLGGMFPIGVQVGVDGVTGLDAVFASLGTTFFSASTQNEAPYELLRIRTAPIDLSLPDALVPSLTLVTGSMTIQNVDLSVPPELGVGEFSLPVTQSEIFTVADIVPEPTTGFLATAALGWVTLIRRKRR